MEKRKNNLYLGLFRPWRGGSPFFKVVKNNLGGLTRWRFPADSPTSFPQLNFRGLYKSKRFPKWYFFFDF